MGVLTVFCPAQELCSPLVGVLVTMQLDTGILIANYKQACLSTRR